MSEVKAVGPNRSAEKRTVRGRRDERWKEVNDSELALGLAASKDRQ